MVSDRDADAAGRGHRPEVQHGEGCEVDVLALAADRRQQGVSYTVHRTLAFIEDEEERFAVILTPPEGKTWWTPDDARRHMGNQVETPVSPREKISAIHSRLRRTCFRLCRPTLTWGCRTVSIIDVATSQAAGALGLGDVTGKVAPGHCADLLLVDGDPLLDLSALSRVQAVFASGLRHEPNGTGQ
ncbi:hypothetical protein SSIG_07781 [Streptomyces filamentosus NRRL 11379]|nr:hypothetical protein SSIG_07821 [Streptomyces filamentosus NRRL 11379]EWS96351.1 hypothetical protein SSIG_07781 [Streptomyces filamentosus NRRL 11379]